MEKRHNDQEQIHNPLVKYGDWLDVNPGNEHLIEASDKIEDLWGQWKSGEKDELTTFYDMYAMYSKYVRKVSEEEDEDGIGAFILQSASAFCIEAQIEHNISWSAETYIDNKAKAGLL